MSLRKGHPMKTLKICLLLCLMLFAGCASAPDMVSTKKSEGETYSADDVRKMTVDQPFLISGDYFREKEQRPAIEIGKSEPERPKTVQPVKMHQVAPEPRKTASSAILPIKVGFLLSQNLAASSAAAVFRAIPESAKNFPVLVMDQEEIAETLQNSDCLKNEDTICASQNLGAYPGLRMIIMLEQFDMSEKFPANISARFSLTDTGIDFSYPGMNFGKVVQQKEELPIVIREIVNSVLSYAVKKSEIMPAFCRVFSSENQKFHITAGKLSGVKPGDQLKVSAQGNLVKSPAGLPAGWIPGKPKGVIKVETLFGKDFAACSLISGEMPKSQDIITE
ncbi:MAG TPA: hypothetical protein DCQ37_22775 [Desulfobacteraceae bacterium]|nr:hypothetical protein [Desulfobacteraceae bacterium]